MKHMTSLVFLGIIIVSLLLIPCEASSGTVRILFVKSMIISEYELTIAELKSTLHEQGLSYVGDEVLFMGNTDSEIEFWGKSTANKPDIIVTVGTTATRSAIVNVRTIPIIYTMVLDNLNSSDVQSGRSVNRDVNGVTLSIPVQEQFEKMLEAMPFVRRVGLLYDKESDQIYLAARNTTQKMSLRLVTNEISTERDIPEVLREILPEIDVFWIPPNAVIYERNNLRYIIRECYTNSIPIIAVSEQIARAGAPLALGVDYQDIGRQTAELLLKRLSGNSVTAPVVETPRKVILYINNRVATSLGLNIPDRILEKAISVDNGR